jgi:hypothetical protein
VLDDSVVAVAGLSAVFSAGLAPNRLEAGAGVSAGLAPNRLVAGADVVAGAADAPKRDGVAAGAVVAG